MLALPVNPVASAVAVFPNGGAEARADVFRSDVDFALPKRPPVVLVAVGCVDVDAGVEPKRPEVAPGWAGFAAVEAAAEPKSPVVEPDCAGFSEVGAGVDPKRPLF